MTTEGQTKELRISAELSLPLDAATRRLAILAVSGAGKSNTAVVMAEAMFDAGIPWVAIDPKGDWWGIRSSKSGRGPGLPIPIFGGLHGDIPLEPGSGKLIGDLVVDQRLTCVLDVSEFDSRQLMWGFLTDLGETLLRRNRQPLHVFLEEADEYLPQSTKDRGNLPKCLGVWQRLVKRGRFRGMGTTQISQRSAALNKDTLYMAEALIAMRAAGKGDRKAIEGWVEHNQASDEIVNSLPLLEDGEAWVSSPAWLKLTARVKFLRRRTFDSGSTPVLMDGHAKPATLADVNLDALRDRMAATIERAKADDPAELRKVIAGLKRELAAKPAPAAPPPTPAPPAKPVEVPVIKPADMKRLEVMVNRLQAIGEKAAEQAKAADGLFRQVAGAVNTAFQRQREPAQAPPAPRPAAKAQPPTPRTPRPQSEPGAVTGLTGPEQRILDAIAWLESIGVDEPEQPAVAFLAGYTFGAGAFNNPKGSLNKKQLVTYLPGNRIRLTAEGRVAARQPEEPPSTEELHRRVLARLPGPEQRLLRPLLDVYPEAMTNEALAVAAKYTPGAGAFNNPKGRLKGLGLVEYPIPGSSRARSILFLDGR